MKSISIGELQVLLAEPSGMQYRVIQESLVRCGVRHLEHVQRGEQALAAMRRAVPDLVISAMYLPDMTGAGLVRHMRGEAALETVPFMLISSEDDFDSLDEVRQAGVVAILPKPFQPGELKRALYATVEFLDPDALQLGDVFAEELKVLVVDDSQFARGHIRRTLEGFGIEQITEAADGREAAGILEHQLFDFVVTDYNMPGMDGAELVSHIRHRSGQSDLPILMVTSEEDAGRLEAVTRENVAICDKPFEAAVVRGLIQEMLQEPLINS
ncbi:MAG TPA: response regulator [Methylothermaceae bacterium]|nr:response regulator [Methylothermaceae bacterium]